MVNVHHWGYMQVLFLMLWVFGLIGTLRRLKDPLYIRYLESKEADMRGAEWVSKEGRKNVRLASGILSFVLELLVLAYGGFFS